MINKILNSKNNLPALLLYISIILLQFILGIFVKRNAMYFFNNNLYSIITLFFNISILFIMYILCKKYNISLKTIGFSFDTIKRSIVVGGAIIIITGLISNLSSNIFISVTNVGMYTALIQLFYFLFLIAFPEEILFRGFIGSNFLLCNKVISTIIVGLMDVTCHMPFQIIVGQLSLSDFSLFKIVNVVFLHCIFQYLFNRYKSFIPSTILHFSIDYFSWLSYQ